MPMKKDFTFIFFIKNIYSKSSTGFIHHSSWLDNDLTDRVNNEFSPSRESLKRILDFARTYDVLETKSAGEIELILN